MYKDLSRVHGFVNFKLINYIQSLVPSNFKWNIFFFYFKSFYFVKFNMICHFRVKHIRDTNKNIPKKATKKNPCILLKFQTALLCFRINSLYLLKFYITCSHLFWSHTVSRWSSIFRYIQGLIPMVKA